MQIHSASIVNAAAVCRRSVLGNFSASHIHSAVGRNIDSSAAKRRTFRVVVANSIAVGKGGDNVFGGIGVVAIADVNIRSHCVNSAADIRDV